MKYVLPAALREAAALTRDGRLPEATKLIRNVLTPPAASRSSRDQEPSAGDQSMGGRPMLRDASLKPRAEGANPPDLLEKLGPRLKGRLGDVIRALGLAKLHGLRPDAQFLRHGLRKAPDVPEGAAFLDCSFTAAAGTRTYKLYVPRALPAKPALVVMLHGCTQDADDFALGTGMNQLADEFGLLVAYPNQPNSVNPSSCWNWFAPKDQRRGTGEPSIIAGLTSEIVGRYAVDPDRMFVAGLSAGGAMAAVMASTYPELYAAIGVHSGLPYRAATDLPSAFAAMKGQMASSLDASPVDQAERSRVPAIVFHGSGDRTVHPSNAERIVDALRQDGSVASFSEGVAGGRRFTRTIVSSAGGSPLAESWMVDGAGHAWSGGNADASFTDASGPSASREMVRFFLGAAAANAGRSDFLGAESENQWRKRR